MRFRYLYILIIGALSVTSQAQTYDQWVTRSFDYLEQDSLALAEQALHNALHLEPANPQNALLLSNMGTIQRRLGKYQKAELSYSSALSLLPGNISLLRNRAALYAEMERWNDAIVDYTDLLNQDNHDEDAHYERALLKLVLNDTIGARKDLEAIDTFNPHSAKSRLGMAYVYKAEGQYAMAAEMYDAVIAVNPNNHTLLFQRAEVYYLSNRMAVALDDINNSIQIYNKDPMAYILRARIRYAKGDKEYAKRDINQALELGLDPIIADDLIKKCK